MFDTKFVCQTFACEKIGQVADVLKTQGSQLILPVAILHAAAFLLGYFMSRFCKFGESTSRTISIECGMQVSFQTKCILQFNWFSSPYLIKRLIGKATIRIPATRICNR